MYCDKYKEFIVSLYEFIASSEMGDNALSQLLAPESTGKSVYKQPSQLLRNMGDFLNILNRVESSRKRIFELNSQIVATSVGELSKGVPPTAIKDMYDAYERSCKEVDKADIKSAKKKNGRDEAQRKKHVKVTAELIGLLNKEHDETRASVVSQAYQFISSQETWYHESYLTLEVMKRSSDIQSSILDEDKRLLLNKTIDQNDLASVLDKSLSDDTEKGDNSSSSLVLLSSPCHGRKKKERLGVYEGYLLEHKGGNDWSKRYFVLREGGTLLGFEQDGKTLVHTIDLILTSVKVVAGTDTLFEIYSPLFNKMTLCAASGEELKKWVALLDQAKAEKLVAQETTPSKKKGTEGGGADATGSDSGNDNDDGDDDDDCVYNYDRIKLLKTLWDCTERNNVCTDCGAQRKMNRIIF